MPWQRIRVLNPKTGKVENKDKWLGKGVGSRSKGTGVSVVLMSEFQQKGTKK